MYETFVDPYCYRGTNVLKNRLGLRDQRALDGFEIEATAQRFAEPLPAGRFTVSHYRAVHRHIFGDVYPWAGRFRSVRIAKGGSMFCYPEHIPTEMARIFRELRAKQCLVELDSDRFAAEGAHFFAELNAVHPFRDGNGRAQLVFLAMLADHGGRSLTWSKLKPDAFLAAMIEAFKGRERNLAAELRNLLD